ncbi:hypothetical protein AAUPMB_05273, partial [Pasteurella multocida subsp. multocida str. Anand1_buffalo]
FDDLLRLLRDALYSAQGEELAQFIRVQYPFAMIDEFQNRCSAISYFLQDLLAPTNHRKWFHYDWRS